MENPANVLAEAKVVLEYVLTNYPKIEVYTYLLF